jgi:ATP-dependent RNA helicase SUPV3L1/SUV3
MLAPLASLRRLELASTAHDAGPELRALLIRLVDRGGVLERVGSGIDGLGKGQRTALARLGVRVGTLDLFLPEMLRAPAIQAWQALGALPGPGVRPLTSDVPSPALASAMPPVVSITGKVPCPPGYRRLGKQGLRVDLAEKLLRDAHAVRLAAGRRPFALDPGKAISMGLATPAFAHLLRLGGFNAIMPRPPPSPGAGGRRRASRRRDAPPRPVRKARSRRWRS